jgi:hypothetical protein
VWVEHKDEKSRVLVRRLGKDYEGNGCGTMSIRTKCTIVYYSYLLDRSLCWMTTQTKI